MVVLLTLWIISVLGITGTVWFRVWQIRTARINPETFNSETENPLAAARVEVFLRNFFAALRERSRTFFIRVLHVLALLAHRIRIKLDQLVKKMLARIEREKEVLDANRSSEQFLSTIQEYRDTLRSASQREQIESVAVTETIVAQQQNEEIPITEEQSITVEIETPKRKVVRRRTRKKAVELPVETITTEQSTEDTSLEE